MQNIDARQTVLLSVVCKASKHVFERKLNFLGGFREDQRRL